MTYLTFRIRSLSIMVVSYTISLVAMLVAAVIAATSIVMAYIFPYMFARYMEFPETGLVLFTMVCDVIITGLLIGATPHLLAKIDQEL